MARIKFGDYRPDVATVDTPFSPFVRNVYPRADGYGPVGSVQTFTDALGSQCLGLAGAVQSNNATHIFAGTDTKLWKLNGTTRVWADVSVAANYSLQSQELWDFTQFGNSVIAVTSNNNPQVYTLGSSTLFADLGGSPPPARRCTVIKDFLVLAGLTSNPARIQWSGSNNITQWTPGTNQSDFQEFPDGGFVQGITGGEFGLVFQDRAIRRMIYRGPPFIFDFQRISEDRGVLMRYSICKGSSLTFFLSNDGFYQIDLGGGMQRIGDQAVDRTVLNDADLSDHRYMIGVTDPAAKRVTWFYKSRLSTARNVLDKNVTYSWELGKWSAGEEQASFGAALFRLSPTLEGLDSISGSIDALPLSLDAYTSDLAANLAVMTSSGTLGFLDGANKEAVIETPEGQAADGRMTWIRDVAPICDAGTAQVSVKFRDRLLDVQSQTVETPIGQRGYASTHIRARYNSVRVRVPAGSNWTYATGVEVDARSGGRR